MSAPAIALNRFGLGARPDEPAPADPQRWLLSQFDAYEPLPAPWKPLPRTPALVEVWLAQQRAVRQAPEGQRSGIREAYLRQGARGLRGRGRRAHRPARCRPSTPFVERLVHFWSNHFAVSVDKLLVVGLAGGFEADAIRPHVLGRFEDLLLAVVRHPAMLLYLDQAQSIGPAARRACARRTRQQRRRGLNENLAREILELHTLGVRSGYTQEDVTEFARALTGWTLPGDDARGRRRGHLPLRARAARARRADGARPQLCRRRRAAGPRHPPRPGDRAGHRAPHRHASSRATSSPTIRRRRWCSAWPTPSRARGGDLPSVYRELVASPEAWQPASAKFKSPWDWAVSSLRALGRQRDAAGAGRQPDEPARPAGVAARLAGRL